MIYLQQYGHLIKLLTGYYKFDIIYLVSKSLLLGSMMIWIAIPDSKIFQRNTLGHFKSQFENLKRVVFQVKTLDNMIPQAHSLGNRKFQAECLDNMISSVEILGFMKEPAGMDEDPLLAFSFV